MNISRMLLGISMTLAFLLPGEALSSRVQHQGDRKVVFEEIELINVGDPSKPVYLGQYGARDGDPHQFLAVGKTGSFFDGGRPNGLQAVGDLVYVADGSDGLEIIRFRKDNARISQ
jgi:hypothetical protein